MDKKILDGLTKEIPVEELELRIGTVKNGSGFSLLIYKNSRVDVKRLNEVCGAMWMDEYRVHKQNGKDCCVCRISIWDDETQQWVYREGVGVESYTEPIKGMYSDAIKRAGFRWGIGIELYETPFIWIPWKQWKSEKKPKVYLDTWNVRKDPEISIVDKHGNIMWSQGRTKKEKSSGSSKKAGIFSKEKEKHKEEHSETIDDVERRRAVERFRELSKRYKNSSIAMPLKEVVAEINPYAENSNDLSVSEIRKLNKEIEDALK